MSLLLIGIRSPDHAGEPALRGGADPEAARAAPHGGQPGDLRRPRSAGLLRDRTSGCSSRRTTWSRSAIACATRSASARTRCSSRSTRTSRSTRCRSASSSTTASTSASRAASSAATTASTSGSPRCRRAACSSSTRASRCYNAANELITNDPPSRYHPQMTARVAGPIATGIANRQAVDRRHQDGHRHLPGDGGRSRSASTSAGCARSPLTGIPAVIGAAIAFAVAELAFGYLTVVDVVPGVDHRRQRHQLRDRAHVALRGAARARRGSRRRRCARRWRGIWRGTLVASISASAAYASLMVTSFRGFYQFGVMGAVGSLACWLATFTVLPALLVLLDRRARAISGRCPPAIEFAPAGTACWRGTARLDDRVLFTILAIVGAVGMRHFLQDPFEYDFRKLTAKLKTTDEAQAVQPQRRQTVRALAVADHRAGRQRRRGGADQADDPQAGRGLPRARRDRPGGHDLGSAPRRPRGAAAQAGADRADPQADPRPVARASSTTRRRPTSPRSTRPPGCTSSRRRTCRRSRAGRSPRVDGTIGRVVLVYPPRRSSRSGTGATCCGSPRCCSTCTCRTARWSRPRGRRWSSRSMIRSILRDGPIATAASLIAVLIIICFTIRPAAAALMALATLTAGRAA